MPKSLKNPLSTILLVALISTALILVTASPLGTAQTATVITSNMTWSKAASPINLQGNVLVKDSAILTIEPGVTVNFGNYYLRVEGGATLNARGTQSSPISFKGAGELSGVELVTCAPWNEQASSGTIIEAAVIEFAALNCDNAKISNCAITVTNALTASGVYSDVSSNKINGNMNLDGGAIFNNTINGNIETQYSPKISYNTIKGSITISGYDNDQPVISHNSIEGTVTQIHTCPTITDNDITGKVTLSNGIPTIVGNTFHGGLSLTDKNATISNNSFLGGEVGISVGAIFQHIYVTIANNTISGCSTAGIQSSNDAQDYGDVTLLISGNVIKDCNYGAVLSGIESTVEGNLFANNKYGLVGGGSVQHNTFSGNEVGVDSNGNVSYNNFQNNKYGFSLQAPNLYLNINVDASNNWWGTTDIDAIKQTLFDYKNDFNLGNITFEPFLTAPDAKAPSTSYQPSTANPTTQPIQTAAPSQSTAGTPSQPNTQAGTILGFEWRDFIIVILGLAVAILAISIVLMLKSKRKRSNNSIAQS